MEQLNHHTAVNNSESMFVTVWLGVLEISSGVVTAVNAGHEYPIVRTPGGIYELLKDTHGMAAGMIEGARFREYELKLEPGSSLFVYSDGYGQAAQDVIDGKYGKDAARFKALSAAGFDPIMVQRIVNGMMLDD